MIAQCGPWKDRRGIHPDLALVPVSVSTLHSPCTDRSRRHGAIDPPPLVGWRREPARRRATSARLPTATFAACALKKPRPCGVWARSRMRTATSGRPPPRSCSDGTRRCRRGRRRSRARRRGWPAASACAACWAGLPLRSCRTPRASSSSILTSECWETRPFRT